MSSVTLVAVPTVPEGLARPTATPPPDDAVLSEPEERTVIGPLTTVFTPAADCSHGVRKDCGTKICPYVIQGQKCLVDQNTPNADALSCWPPAAASSIRPEDPSKFRGWGIYSPGFMCPLGYTSACTATAGVPFTDWVPQFSLLPQETIVGCCPTGFKCEWGNKGQQTCLKKVYEPSTVQLATCSNGKFLTSDFVLPVLSTVTKGEQDEVIVPVTRLGFFNPMAAIAWRPNDLQFNGSTSFLESHGWSEVPSNWGLNTSSTVAAGSSVQGGSVNDQPTHQGLSTATTIAVAVVVPFCVFLLAAGAILVCLHRRRARRLRAAACQNLSSPSAPGGFGYIDSPASQQSFMHSASSSPSDTSPHPHAMAGHFYEKALPLRPHDHHPPAARSLHSRPSMAAIAQAKNVGELHGMPTFELPNSLARQELSPNEKDGDLHSRGGSLVSPNSTYRGTHLARETWGSGGTLTDAGYRFPVDEKNRL